MDGISFWNMGPAANSWFDRKHFAVDRRPRCNASQLLAQQKKMRRDAEAALPPEYSRTPDLSADL